MANPVYDSALGINVNHKHSDAGSGPSTPQIQADWEQTNAEALDFIKGKPEIFTVANDPYGLIWSGDTGQAPSRDAMYQFIQTLPGGHDPVSLDVNAATLLSLSTQAVGLVDQAKNMVLAGPASGLDAVPVFRYLSVDDMPDISGIYAIAGHNHDELYATVGFKDTLDGVTGLIKSNGAGTYSAAQADVDFQSPLGFVPENAANKSTSTALGASNTLYPSQYAVKTYVDNLVSGIAGGLHYVDILDASAGVYPESPTTGDYYIVSVPGTIEGKSYAVSDWAVYNGVWNKIDNQTITVTASLGIQKVGSDLRVDFVLNDGLKLISNSITVAYDNSSIGIVGNALAVKALGVTNGMLAGSIADSKLLAVTTAEKVAGSALYNLGTTPAGAGRIPVANLGSGSPDDTTALYGDGVWKVPAGTAGGGTATLTYSKNLDTNAASVVVSGTQAATAIYSKIIPGGTLDSSGALSAVITGTYVNSSGSSKTVSVIVKYGGVVLPYRSFTTPSSTATGAFLYKIELLAAGSVTSQSVSVKTAHTYMTTGCAETLPITTMVNVNSAVDQSLEVLVMLSSTHLGIALTKKLAILNKENATDLIGAPTDASYVTLSANGNLSNERVLTGTVNNLAIADGGAGNPVVLSVPANAELSVAQLTNLATAGFVKTNATGLLSVDTGSYATTGQLAGKQDTLVSGTSIKTVNGTSLLGSGNIVIAGGGGGGLTVYPVTADFDINTDLRLFANHNATEDIVGTIATGLPDGFRFGVANRKGGSVDFTLLEGVANSNNRSGVAIDSLGNIYCSYYYDGNKNVYKQDVGTGTWTTCGSVQREYQGIAIDLRDDTLYAVEDNGKIYKRAYDDTDFTEISGVTSRRWAWPYVHTNGDVYYCVASGNAIYKQEGGIGDPVLYKTVPHVYAAGFVKCSNGDEYACGEDSNYSPYVCRRVGGAGDFADIQNFPGTTLQGMAVAPNDDIYVGNYSGNGASGVFIKHAYSSQFTVLDTFTPTLQGWNAYAIGAGRLVISRYGGKIYKSNLLPVVITITPPERETIGPAVEVGSSIRSVEENDYTEYVKIDGKWVQTSNIGSWYDMLNGFDLITTSAIAGLTMPVRNATPVTTITPIAQYTGTVTWSPDDETFGAETVYTATVTITPNTGYTNVGLPADFFTASGATSSHNSEDASVVTVVFPETTAVPVGPPTYIISGASTTSFNKTDWENTGWFNYGTTKPIYMSKATLQNNLITYSTQLENGSGWVMSTQCILTFNSNNLTRLSDAQWNDTAWVPAEGHTRWTTYNENFDNVTIGWSSVRSRWEVILDADGQSGTAGDILNYHETATDFWIPGTGWHSTVTISMYENGWYGMEYINTTATGDTIPVTGNGTWEISYNGAGYPTANTPTVTLYT